MRVAVDQLAPRLERELAPVYVLSGDEPLQIQECRDAVREAARARGHDDRVLLEVDRFFDWSTFRSCSDSLSLFAARRVIDLRMPSGAPGADGAKVLRAYAARPNPDDVLVVSTGRLDGRTTATQWFKALEGAGVYVAIYPIELRALPGWIAARAARLGLRLDAGAVAVLAERGEGNLLACAQEIEKLRMLHGPGAIGPAEVLEAVADSARYGAFDLVDTALAGDAARAARIVRALHEEGVEPLPVLGSLAWALRGVGEIAARVEAGDALDRVLTGRLGMWRMRRRVLDPALGRRDAAGWARLLRLAAEVDRRVKGTPSRRDRGLRWRPPDAWDALEALALAMAGVNIVDAPPYNEIGAPRAVARRR